MQIQQNGITCSASSEDLTPISEIIGIACGIATIVDSLAVNPNRITRIQTTGARLDFEFQVNGTRCQLECKGTTYRSKLKGMLRKKKQKKQRTKRKADASFGAFTIYDAGGRGNRTEVIVVDPPTGARGMQHTLSVLESVLRHYWMYFQAILTPNEFTESLLSVLRALERGEEPPAMRGRPDHRVKRDFPEHGTFLGALFDARIAGESVARFDSFEAATAELGDATTFVGVHESVLELIRINDWSGLLQLSWPRSVAGSSVADFALLPSGVASAPDPLSADELAVTASTFATARRLYLRRRAALGDAG